MGNHRDIGVIMRKTLLLTSKCKHYCSEQEWLIEHTREKPSKNDGFSEIKKGLIRSLMFKLIEGSNLENAVLYIRRTCVIDIT